MNPAQLVHLRAQAEDGRIENPNSLICTLIDEVVILQTRNHRLSEQVAEQRIAMDTYDDSRDVDEHLRVRAIMDSNPHGIFVFGSNRAGIHGAGAAYFAWKVHDAEWGQAEGPQGRSYAIPTKDKMLKTLSLFSIHEHVMTFLEYARSHPDLIFAITRIGCGLAGYKAEDIAPMFKDAPENCKLPEGWRT